MRPNNYRVTTSTRIAGAFALSLIGVSTLASVASADLGLNPGDILISNHGGNNVQRLQPDGTVTTLTTLPGTPTGLTFDANSNLYINLEGGSIYKLDAATDTLSQIITNLPSREGLAYDPTSNHLFSASFGGGTIDELTTSGALLRSISVPGLSNPVGVSVRGGTLLFTDNGTGHIFKGTTTGSTFTQIGSVSAGNGYAVDIDTSGNIYANDFNLNKTVKFTLSGSSYTPSDFITGLNNPANGLSIGDDGSFTIDEYSANAIDTFNSDGSLRHHFTGIANPDELVVFAPIRQAGGVPEPGSVALLVGMAVGGASILRRRRK